MPIQTIDAQSALGFVVSQRSHIESEVLKKPYPQIRYARLIPVDTSANPFAPSVTHFSQESNGQAKFINGKGDDIPLVNISGSKFEQTVKMAGVGYSFSFEEIGAAQGMGANLSSEGAEAANMAYEQFVDAVACVGDAATGIEGLFNTTGITTTAAAKTFATSTPQEILNEINGQLTAINVDTAGIEFADTIVMPLAVLGDIGVRQLAAENPLTILDFIQMKNMYSLQTGLPLNIVADRRLTDKMLMYRRDPQVLKMHMPMPLQFIAPQVVNLEVKTLGMFRFAPLQIRRPKAMRYLTGVAA